VSHSEKFAISIRAPFLCAQRFLYSRAILKSSRFLLASHSEKVAISIRAPYLCAQRFLFASHSENLAISIRAPGIAINTDTLIIIPTVGLLIPVQA